MSIGTSRPNRMGRWLGTTTVLPCIRAVAIDLDGTLLDSRHRVSDASRAAIAAAREAGLRIILASSRAPAAMWPILEVLELTEPEVFVGSQGAVTAAYTGTGFFRPIANIPIPMSDAASILRIARSMDLTVNWFTGDQWMVSQLDEHVRREADIVGFGPTVANLSAAESAPDKLMFMVEPKDTDKLGFLNGRLPAGAKGQISNPTYLEVTNASVDKGSAVRAICQDWGISGQDIAAFGDGPNDLGLFGYAGTSIAPISARPSVLDAATFVTSSNDDDGVAWALRIITTNYERRDQ